MNTAQEDLRSEIESIANGIDTLAFGAFAIQAERALRAHAVRLREVSKEVSRLEEPRLSDYAQQHDTSNQV